MLDINASLDSAINGNKNTNPAAIANPVDMIPNVDIVKLMKNIPNINKKPVIKNPGLLLFTIFFDIFPLL